MLADRLRAYFVKTDGQPRTGTFMGTGYAASDCDSDAAWKRHRNAAAAVALQVADALRAFRRDLNVVLSRGVWRIFAVTLSEYHKTLDSRSLFDFSGVLERAVKLLKDGRIRAEPFQARSAISPRAGRRVSGHQPCTVVALVAQLVRNWGEAVCASADAIQPTIFIVGDRKQSIYGFRDADVSVLDEAADFVTALRSGTTRDVPSRSASARSRRFWPSSTRSSPRWRRPATGSTDSGTTRPTGFDRRGGAGDGTIVDARASRRARTGRRERSRITTGGQQALPGMSSKKTPHRVDACGGRAPMVRSRAWRRGRRLHYKVATRAGAEVAAVIGRDGPRSIDRHETARQSLRHRRVVSFARHPS